MDNGLFHFFVSSRRRHTRCGRDWSSDVCSSDLGEYLVRAVGHCGECHTPRTMTMATDNSRFLAGNPKGPEDSEVPNITPDKATGLTWSEEEIADYLETGNKPDGDVAGGVLGEVIDGTLARYKELTKADPLAVAP